MSATKERAESFAANFICPKCGVDAACDCGVAPIERAKAAVIANPQMSNRAIAAEIGVHYVTVHRARGKAGVSPATTDKRIGRDGRAYKPTKAVIVKFPSTEQAPRDDRPDAVREFEEGPVAWVNRASEAKILAGYAPIGTCPISRKMLKAAKEAEKAWTTIIDHIEREMKHGS